MKSGKLMKKVLKKDVDMNLHEGHRQRLLELAITAGLDDMSEFQVMEFFLTYIFPRGDVNPLAHRLLEIFDSFSHVVDADVNDLIQVPGINERSAKKISMFSELFYHYTSAKMGRKYVVKCKADILDVVEDHLRFRTTENMLLLALSAGNIITHKRRINRGSSNNVGISVLELTNFIATSKPASIVVAHCHPYGKSLPSGTDGEAFQTVRNLCETCGINFVDSYILGEDGIYSQKDEEILRSYCDIEDRRKQ